MKLLGIDGDIVRYRCGFAGQKTWYHWYSDDEVGYDKETDTWDIRGTPLSTHENAADAKAWAIADRPSNMRIDHLVRVPEVKLEPLEHTLHSVKRVIGGMIARYPDYHPAIYTSCPTEDNWRTQFYPEYKANRQLQRKPYYAYDIDQYMRKKWDVIDHPTKEADDLIAEQAYISGDDFITCTIDKDLLQLPGKHWNWVTEEERTVTHMEAMRLLAVQRIHGDSTDNIKGIPGWGEKSAQVWMEQCPIEDLDALVQEAFSTAKDKKGELIFGPTEALYHAALTTALVTLPVTDAHRELLVDGVHRARKAYETVKQASEHAGDTGGNTG